MGLEAFIHHQSIGPVTEIVVGGVLHCETGPAVFNEDMSYQAFYVNGKLHRIGDLPALIDTRNGFTTYSENGIVHRLGKPARIGPWGSERYIVHGRYHRIDGPAVKHVSATGAVSYEFWIDGARLTEVEFLLKTKAVNEKELLAAIATKRDEKLVARALIELGYNKKHAKQIAERAAIAKIFVR